jgi:hypothetical protein
MKKDHIRDYATEAFRYYAFLGKPHKEDLEQKYYDEAKEEFKREYHETKGTGIFKPTEAQVIYAESKVREKQAELWDILAVEKTMQQLAFYERAAVDIVYFQEPHRDIKKGDIRDRVVQASLHIPAGTATVYRYLRKARLIFAYERGLRV